MDGGMRYSSFRSYFTSHYFFVYISFSIEKSSILNSYILLDEIRLFKLNMELKPPA